MGVSLNGGTPKSSILIRFSIINHPFWGTNIFGNTHISITEDSEFGSSLESANIPRYLTSVMGRSLLTHGECFVRFSSYDA